MTTGSSSFCPSVVFEMYTVSPTDHLVFIFGLRHGQVLWSFLTVTNALSLVMYVFLMINSLSVSKDRGNHSTVCLRRTSVDRILRSSQLQLSDRNNSFATGYLAWQILVSNGR